AVQPLALEPTPVRPFASEQSAPQQEYQPAPSSEYQQPQSISVQEPSDHSEYSQTSQSPLPNNHPLAPLGNLSQPAVVYADGPVVSPPQRSRRKRNLILGAAATVALLLGSAGYVFGYYIPNKPENVWATGMERSGTVLTTLMTEATDKETAQAFESTSLSGNMEIRSQDQVFKGAVASSYSQTTSDNTFTIQLKDQSGADQKVAMNLLTDIPAGKEYPDIFFKYTGLAALGADAYLPAASSYEGKWITVSSDYIASFLPAEEAEELKREELTHQDAAELGKIITDTTREYVLTSDESKSVLVRKSFVATEKLGNVSAHHYKVSLNKENAVRFCTALTERIMSSKAYLKLPWADAERVEQDKKDSLESCKRDAAESIDEKDTFDMWIDRKYKLIHKIRITDQKERQDYVEIGQSYSGGDEIPLFVVIQSKSDEYHGRIDLKVNQKTDTTTASVDFAGDGEDDFAIKAQLTFKPYKGVVTIERPKTTVPIQAVLKQLGLDPSNPYGDPAIQTVGQPAQPGRPGSIQAKAQDTERKTDMRALQSQLETYYAAAGRYPTLAEINDTAWRSKNMKGADTQAFVDPTGTASILIKTATKTQYGYDVRGCGGGGQDCQVYTLTAFLADGSLHELESINSDGTEPV
ncbi:MAG TPA: hypothetical protein VK983_03895, partial [Candidatus Limnocylindrales bacterium]|nr:hypothetical protein [Candidatus Limnocylindrales bacterium]